MPNTSRIKRARERVVFVWRVSRLLIPAAVRAIREGKPLMIVSGPIGKKPEAPKV